MSKKSKIIDCIYSQDGEFDQHIIAGQTDASVPYVTNVIKPLVASGHLLEFSNGRRTVYRVNDEVARKIVENTAEEPRDNFLAEFSVKDRFEYVEKFASMVVNKATPSLFMTGVAGIGKSHIISKVLDDHQLEPEEDYKIIKGHVSPFGLYHLLYHNRDKLLVFDDCDKVFENDIAANLLKAALDSYDKRVLNWSGRAIPDDSDVEQRFEYNGQVIFISNTPIESLDDAVRSRTMCINLHMSREEVTEHMRNILQFIEPKTSLGVKREVIEFLDTVSHSFSSYNLRTLIKAIRIRNSFSEPTIWQNMIRVSASNE